MSASSHADTTGVPSNLGGPDRPGHLSVVSSSVMQAASIVTWLIGVGYYVFVPLAISAAIASLVLRLARR
jgi:hypothetical protein